MQIDFDKLRSKLRNLALFTLLATSSITEAAQAADPLAIAEQGYFFVGGQYTTSKNGQKIMVGQMFVQYQIPQQRAHRFPIIMWHGGGQTGTNFLGTPDGRPGWAEYFARHGYAVYVVDQPARARSGFFTEAYGATRRPNATAMSERFTAPEIPKRYPQAALHTQWPGAGAAGDPVFDQYLTQTGVKHSFVRLPEVDIHGNGHMMMLEKNNLQIAALLRGWIEKNVR